MPAVLVHGVPDTHRLWDTVHSHLERNDIITVDLPGFGNPLPSGFRSTKPIDRAWTIRFCRTDSPTSSAMPHTHAPS